MLIQTSTDFKTGGQILAGSGVMFRFGSLDWGIYLEDRFTLSGTIRGGHSVGWAWFAGNCKKSTIGNDRVGALCLWRGRLFSYRSYRKGVKLECNQMTSSQQRWGNKNKVLNFNYHDFSAAEKRLVQRLKQKGPLPDLHGANRDYRKTPALGTGISLWRNQRAEIHLSGW